MCIKKNKLLLRTWDQFIAFFLWPCIMNDTQDCREPHLSSSSHTLTPQQNKLFTTQDLNFFVRCFKQLNGTSKLVDLGSYYGLRSCTSWCNSLGATHADPGDSDKGKVLHCPELSLSEFRTQNSEIYLLNPK